jgi:predicted translin family RNA/ssDNA-binding protein
MEYINKKDFQKVIREHDRAESERDKHISLSREIIKVSKIIIYAIHNNEIKKAKLNLSRIKDLIKDLKKLNTTRDNKVAIQEYVEAIAFYTFITEKRLIKISELDVDYESYLLGLCDLTGELMRKAVNSVIAEDLNLVKEIFSFIKALQGEFLKINIRNNELRKKYDAIKWNLAKVEDIIFNLKMREQR